MNATAEPMKPSLIVVSLADTPHIRQQARGRWGSILRALNISVPDGPMKHGPCPACGGEDRFRFDDKDGFGTWYCNQCEPHAGDGFQLVMNVRGCDFSEAVERVMGALGDHSRNSHTDRRIAATYDYITGDGRVLFQVVRFIPKDFRQRRPDGHGGWTWNLTGIEPVLYKLPDLVKADHVLIVEGEKDVETACRLGLPDGWTATCNPMGAGKWRDSYSDALRDKHVVVLPDADGPGENHAAKVAQSLQGKAATVRRLTLPGGVKDFSLWAMDRTQADVHVLLTHAVPWVTVGIVGSVGVGPDDDREEPADCLIPAPRFPLEVLPSVLQDFIAQTSASLPVPVDLVAAPVLACLGAAIGAHREIRPKANWTTTAALYIGCVADPGSLKSPALNLAAFPVRAQQHTYEQDHQEAMARYEESQMLYTRGSEAHRKNKTDIIPAKPMKPTLRRTWTADFTTERLAGILSENPHGVLIVRDELSAWIKSFNQYKNGKGADKQFFLSAWSGEPLAVDRQSKDPVLVPHPFLSVVGCIPPDVLPDLDEDNREDGFLHRLLLVYPDSVSVRWTETVVQDSVKMAYSNLLAQLYALSPNLDGSPVILGLSPNAKALFIEWHDTHCAEAENPALPSQVRGAYAKLKGYAPRLALIHALAANPYAKQVEERSIGAAVDLVEYFKTQAQRVAPLLGCHARTPEARCEQSIRRACAHGRSLSKRDAHRAGNHPASVFNPVWADLLKRQVLVSGANEAGGRTKHYLLRVPSQTGKGA